MSEPGCISAYWVSRYGFHPDCQVIVFTGDNPASVAGLQLMENDICISLGSSDTILTRQRSFPAVNQLTSLPTAMGDSIDPELFMLMFCFKNGSLMRDKLCRELCAGSWQQFNQLIQSQPPGNDGNFGLFYDWPEITPRNRLGRFVRQSNGEIRQWNCTDNSAMSTRALLEGQVMAKYLYVQQLGVQLNSSNKVILTGGASVNECLAQIFADVFNCSIYVSLIANSAAFGSALRAKWGKTGCGFNGNSLFCKKVSSPRHADIYTALMSDFAAFDEKCN